MLLSYPPPTSALQAVRTNGNGGTTYVASVEVGNEAGLGLSGEIAANFSAFGEISANFSGLTEGIQYGFRVRARTLHADAYVTAPVAETHGTPTAPPLLAVTGLAAQSVTRSSVLVQWAYAGTDLVGTFLVEAWLNRTVPLHTSVATR
eukprot:3692508-Rhodomonas_salina.4